MTYYLLPSTTTTYYLLLPSLLILLLPTGTISENASIWCLLRGALSLRLRAMRGVHILVRCELTSQLTFGFTGELELGLFFFGEGVCHAGMF